MPKGVVNPTNSEDTRWRGFPGLQGSRGISIIGM